MLVRQFDREIDYPLICGWWKAHEREPLPLEMLPKLGVVVLKGHHPQAALWLYMDNSVGVCFLERAVTRPGLTLEKSKVALSMGIDFLKREAAELGYGVMFLRTYPALARFAKELGFVEDDRPAVCMVASTGGGA